VSARDPNALRKILGDLPPVEPLTSDDEAWRRIAVKLAAEPDGNPRLVHRTPWWIAGAVAAGLAGATALLLLQSGPPAPLPSAPAQVAAVLLPPPKIQVAPSAGVEATGSAVSVSDGKLATLITERQEIAAGSRVVTARGEAKLHFPGGSVTLLEPDSSVQLARLDPDNIEVELQAGAIFVHAAFQMLRPSASARQPAKPASSGLGHGQLAVRTGAYRVIVHGTGFRVERKAGQVEVGLWHGSVEVRADGATQGLMLEPGHKLRFSEAHGLAGVVARPLGEGAESGVAEEARLLGLAAPAAKPTRHAAAAAPPLAQSALPAPVVADIARCRALASKIAESAGQVRLDLTLADDGHVTDDKIEPGGDAKLASCVGEAALNWKLDAPAESMRGVQVIFPVPMK
jgi:ferric-dicitrate binding protein FerR (iron transport regulator)